MFAGRFFLRFSAAQPHPSGCIQKATVASCITRCFGVHIGSLPAVTEERRSVSVCGTPRSSPCDGCSKSKRRWITQHDRQLAEITCHGDAPPFSVHCRHSIRGNEPWVDNQRKASSSTNVPSAIYERGHPCVRYITAAARYRDSCGGLIPFQNGKPEITRTAKQFDMRQ